MHAALVCIIICVLGYKSLSSQLRGSFDSNCIHMKSKYIYMTPGMCRNEPELHVSIVQYNDHRYTIEQTGRPLLSTNTGL